MRRDMGGVERFIRSANPTRRFNQRSRIPRRIRGMLGAASVAAHTRALPTVGPFLHVYMQRLRRTGFPDQNHPGNK